MSIPIILIAFADNPKHPLPYLQEEKDAIKRILSPLEAQKLIDPRIDVYASIDSIKGEIEKYKDNLAIFHYGGHANSLQLFLSDDPAYLGGLAGQLQLAKKLKLVVLNGCSTGGHARFLLEQGIPALIATSAPVDDRKACEFSKGFYSSLANRLTIEEAFFSNSNTLIERGMLDDDEIIRDLKSIEGSKIEEAVWGLEAKSLSFLAWRIEEPLLVNPPELLSTIVEKDPNEHICDALFDKIGNTAGFQEEEHDDSDLLGIKLEHIIKNLPHPISSQLKNLRGKMYEDMESIQQIHSSYIRILRFICILCISNLLEKHFTNTLEKADSVKINKAFLSSYQFLSLAEEDYFTFPYWNLIYNILILFSSLTSAYPKKLSGLLEAFDDSSELYKSITHLNHSLTRKEFEPSYYFWCNSLEYHLSIFLDRVSFLHQFELFNNESTFVYKLRFQEQKMENNLHRMTIGSKKPRFIEENNALEHRAFFFGCKVDNEYINLSPFYYVEFDENGNLKNPKDPNPKQFLRLDKTTGGEFLYFYENLNSVEIGRNYELSQRSILEKNAGRARKSKKETYLNYFQEIDSVFQYIIQVLKRESKNNV